MEISDNILKRYLDRVYFVCGTACGGKTTVSRRLAEKHGIPVYDIDSMFDVHQKMSDPALQPNMNRQFKDADEFFGRSVEEYKAWLLGNKAEQLGFILMDLVKLAEKGRVICDCHLTPSEARGITVPERIVFLTRDPGNSLVDEYCSRPDHQPFSRWLHSAADYEKAKATCSETLRQINEDAISEIKSSEFFYIDRAQGLSVEETVREVERHFGWDTDDGVCVRKVDKGTELADDLLRFVENCSWTEVRDHVADLIRRWRFRDWETMFAAVKDGRVVGMASALRSDYYPLPDTYPWVSCIFVDEENRGNRISGMLISQANEYLKGQGFTRSYIPTDITGLYEKYGYRFDDHIINYGGGSDRLYVKDFT